MNNKIKNHSDFMKYVEQRLTQWSNWFSTGNHYGMGFHSHTIEYILMTTGVMIKSTGVKPLPCNEEAEEIEMLITEMAKQSEENNKMAMALRIKYFSNKKFKEYSHEIGLGASQFNVYILMAKQWLAGRLSC